MRVGSNFLPPNNRGFSMYLEMVERVCVEMVG